MDKTELQARVDILSQEIEFLRSLYEMVRTSPLDKPLLPTLPTKGKSYPTVEKAARMGFMDWLTSIYHQSSSLGGFYSAVLGENFLL
jgi:hypothetical protein